MNMAKPIVRFFFFYFLHYRVQMMHENRIRNVSCVRYVSNDITPHNVLTFAKKRDIRFVHLSYGSPRPLH